MKVDFADITSRIEEKPTWYDVNGTPRYGKPSPAETNLYAEESIAVVIGCQGCYEEFLVVYDASNYEHDWVCVGHSIDGEPGWKKTNEWKMEVKGCTLIADAKIGDPPHYGDPPRHNGCAGDTMNSYAIRTVGYWKKQSWKDARENGEVLELPPYSFTSCNWVGSPDWAKELIENNDQS